MISESMRGRTLLIHVVVTLAVAACAASDRAGFADAGAPGDADLTPEPPFTEPNQDDSCVRAVNDRSSIGCDYVFFYPRAYNARGFPFNVGGGCFAAFVTNEGDRAAKLEVTYGDQTLDVTKFAYVPSGSGKSITYTPLANGELAPRQVAILFLASTVDSPQKCPAGTRPAMSADVSIVGTGYGKTFRVKTSQPVVMYDIFPYGGGIAGLASATLLLPTSSWATNYLAVTPQPGVLSAAAKTGTTSTIGDNSLDPWIAVVAAEDDTHVTLNPSVNLAGGAGIDPAPAGSERTYALKKGEFLQFRQMSELIGTPINSDKPVGVFGGSTCMNIPEGVPACDSAHQQIPPLRALGDEYVAVRPRNRYATMDESPPWRVLAAVDGTRLSYVPERPEGAPETLDKGQFAEFRTSAAFTVKSQGNTHPFYMAGYMDSCEMYTSDIEDCRGDPEFVNVVSPQQYRKSYVFFTDPTYPETHLVVVRKKGEGGFADVKLDCLGVLTGWKAVGDYEYTRVDLVRFNFAGQAQCDNGRHEMTSDAPFGVTVWGWGSGETGNLTRGFYSIYVSYGYPAGASLKFINDVVVK